MLALIATMNAGIPGFLQAAAPTSSEVLTELGTYLTSLVNWAGTVLTTVWDSQILRVVVFLSIPLIGIGIIKRLMDI